MNYYKVEVTISYEIEAASEALAKQEVLQMITRGDINPYDHDITCVELAKPTEEGG